MIQIADLPTRIRSIKQPNWTDTLRWIQSQPEYCVADVDHDWRIWVNLHSGGCVVRNKGQLAAETFPTLTLGLAYLDYREIAP